MKRYFTRRVITDLLKAFLWHQPDRKVSGGGAGRLCRLFLDGTGELVVEFMVPEGGQSRWVVAQGELRERIEQDTLDELSARYDEELRAQRKATGGQRVTSKRVPRPPVAARLVTRSHLKLVAVSESSRVDPDGEKEKP